MKKILILNGPNLNMLGKREPEIYGRQTLSKIKKLCEVRAKSLDVKIDFRQSNHEGELVEWIQGAMKGYAGLIINAAAYTHTSVAIHDALKMLNIPIIELHITDPKRREKFRRVSYIEPLATAVISGKGVKGYELALDKLGKLLNT